MVTGVAGFIGRNVADSWPSMGMDVVGLEDLLGGFLSNVVNFMDNYPSSWIGNQA